MKSPDHKARLLQCETDHETRVLQSEVVLSDAIFGGLAEINAALVEADLPTIDTLRDLEEAFGEASPDDDVTPDIVETLIMFETTQIKNDMLLDAIRTAMLEVYAGFGEFEETQARALAEKRVHESLGQLEN